MPSARVLWTMSPRQRVWAAVSRARRTPAMTDRDFRFNVAVVPLPDLPLVVAVTGNPEYAAERLLQTEAGYRIRVASNARAEATVFSGRYDGVKTYEPVETVLELAPAPVHLLSQVVASNLLHARASGVELNAQWQPVPRWQLDGSYSWLHVTSRADPISRDLTPARESGQGTPAHQWQLRSTFALSPRIEISGWISRASRLRLVEIPGYTRLDARAQFRLNPRLTVAVAAHNLLSRHHPEFADVGLISDVPRSARVELRWTH
jgi:outer membrane receptor protein involved in Fe transport